jgi:peptidoglycan hydrolase CwlO-like protein
MWLLSLALRHWRPLAALALILALIASGYALKARVEAHKREVAALKAQNAEQLEQLESNLALIKALMASAQAAQDARERNDAVIPQARRESAARVDRAGTADDAQRVQDVGAAVEADRAAASLLRGAQSR